MSFGSFGSSQNSPSAFGATGASGGFGAFGGTTTNAGPSGAPGAGSGGNTFGVNTLQNQPQGMGGGMFGATPQQVGTGMPFTQPSAITGDFEIPRDANSPTDSISAVKFSPVDGQNLLLAASWDRKVRCYDIKGTVQHNGEYANLSSEFLACIEHPAPVLDVCFASDGTGCFSAGCSNGIRMWKFEASRGLQQSTEIGRHDAPVKAIGYFSDRNMLVSAGWDRKLKYWDLRSPNPVLSVNLPGRADCMAVGGNYCIVGTGGTEDERQVLTFNLATNPGQPERIQNVNGLSGSNQREETRKPLRRQFRGISLFPDLQGYAIVSIEGRCAIQYINRTMFSQSFSFRCHRNKETNRIYPVNAVAFHRQNGSLVTAGGDGTYCFWDKDSKKQLKASNQSPNDIIRTPDNQPASISCCDFNSSGNLFAYGLSDEWSRGAKLSREFSTLRVRALGASDLKAKSKS